MATPSGPLPYLDEPSGVFGLFARNRAREPNQARQIINWFMQNRPELAEGAIREFGPAAGIGGDYHRLAETFAEPGRRIAEVERLRQPTRTEIPPSSELTGQTQLGPVLQEPTIDFMRQFQQPPMGAAPTALADATFSTAPEVPLPPVPPINPYRLGGIPAWPYPPNTTQLQVPEGPVGPDERAAVVPPTLPEPREFPPPPDVVPEYLRRPEMTAAPPDTFVPGGQRVPIPGRTEITPGMSVSEILRTRPELASTLLTTMPKVQEAIDAEAGMRATEQYQDAINSGRMTPEQALEQFGPDMQRWSTGQKIVAQAEKSLTSQATRAKAQVEAKEKETKAKRDEENRQFLMTRADALRKAGDEEGAVQAELIARDPKMAEEWRQFQDTRAKATQAKAPTEFGATMNVATEELRQRLGREPTDGEKARLALAIADERRIPADEKTYQVAARDLLIKGGNANPSDGDVANKVLELKNISREKGAPKINTQITGAQRDRAAGMLSVLDAMQEIRTDLNTGAQQQVGGPWGMNTRFTGLMAAINEKDPKYDVFRRLRANARNVAAYLLHELTGAAVGGHDSVYMKSVPDIDTMDIGTFMAAMEATEKNYRNILKYSEEIRRTGEIDKPLKDRTTPLPVPVMINSTADPRTAEGSFRAVTGPLARPTLPAPRAPERPVLTPPRR